jgi:cob(I)alamin adenosyltransferase
MSVTTKKGDGGMTSLIGGRRVLKCDDRVEAYGTVDELSAFIGVLHDILPEDEGGQKAFLMEIQKSLLTVEAILACPEEGRMPHLDASALAAVEERAVALEKALPPFRTFILPGGNLAASYCHVCRTVCRRAERMAVKLGAQGVELQYLNRLSDYFFLLARTFSGR